MLQADAPPPTPGGSSPDAKRRRKLAALWLLLVLFVAACFHRPLLSETLRWGLRSAAARKGFTLQTRVSGNLWTRLRLEEVSLEAGASAQGALESLHIRRAALRYSLPDLLLHGAERFLSEVSAEGVDVHLRAPQKPANHAPANPVRLLRAVLDFPLFRTENVRLSGVHVLGADGFELEGGVLEAGPATKGFLEVAQLRLPNRPRPLSFHTKTTFTNRRFSLKQVELGPEATLTRFTVDASGAATGEARFELEARLGSGRLSAHLEAGPWTWLLGGEASNANGRALAQCLGGESAFWPEKFSGRMDIGGSPNRPSSWRGAARLELENQTVQGAPATLQMGAILQAGSLQITSFEGISPETRLTGSGAFRLPKTLQHAADLEGECNLSLTSGQIGEWSPPLKSGPVSGSLGAGARIRLFKGAIQVETRAKLLGVEASYFRAEEMQWEASLTAPLSGLFHLENLAGNALITLNHPEIQHPQASAHFETGACGLSLENGTARLWNIALKDRLNSVTGELSWPLTQTAATPHAAFTLEMPDLRGAGLVVRGLAVEGSLTAIAAGQWQGQSAHGALSASADALKWGAFELPQARLKSTLEAKQLTLGDLSLEWSATEQIHATGGITFEESRPYQIDAEARLPSLEKLAPLLRQLGFADSQLAGALEASWKGSGTLRPLAGTGQWNLKLRDARWNHMNLGLLECEGHYLPDALTVDPLRAVTKDTKFTARLHWSGGALRLDQVALEQWGHPVLGGELTLPLARDATGVHWVENSEISGALKAVNLDLATLLAANGKPAPLSGSVQFALQLAGTPSAPSATLRLSAAKLRAPSAPKFGEVSLTAEGRYVRDAIELSASALSPLGAPVRLSGRLALPIAELLSGALAPKDLPLDATLETNGANLQSLSSLWSGLRQLQGSGSLKVQAKGPLQKPAFSGVLSLDCPVLHFASDRVPAIGDLHLNAEYAGRQLRLTRLKADLGGGSLQIQGGASFADATNPVLDLSAKAREVLVVRLRDLSLRLNGDLALRGPWKKAVISGNASAVKSRYQRDLEVLPLNLLRMQLPRETRTPGKPWFVFRAAPFSDWKFDVSLASTPGDPILFRGNRLRGTFDAEMRLEGTGIAPTIHGAFRTQDLVTSLPFARVEVSNGRLWYTREHPFQPQLDFSAETEVRNHRVRLYVSGPADAPHIMASSEPPENEPDLLALITTGALPGDTTDRGQALTGRAASVLFQEFSSKMFGSGGRESFSALRRFNLDVGGINSRTGQQETQLTYRLKDNVFVIGEIGANGDFAGRVRYLLRFR